LRLTWSDTSIESVAQLEEHLLRFSRSSATRWVNRIRASARDAARFPRSHRVVPEVGEEHIREFFVGPYRVWFRIYDAEQRIDILVVFHGARQVPI